MNNTQRIISLYDGERSSRDVAQIVGLSPRYVRRIAQRLGLERLHCGAQKGENNHQYVSGRRIDLDGYVLITAPDNHPYARKRKGRLGKVMFEHRLIMEQKLGRYLLPTEVVDHIDGITLHNDPKNLRLFEKNGDHLSATITGLPKHISVSGKQNIKERNHLPLGFEPVDIFYLRRKRGDVRLRGILLAALSLGIDSPYLLGTHRLLEKKGICLTSHQEIEQAYHKLCQRWEEDLLK
jgi:hypothetical protein